MDLALQPMTAAQFDGWRERSMRDYAQEFVDSGALPPADAKRRAAADFQRLLPGGLATEQHDLWTAVDRGESVGVIWVFTQDRPTGPESFIYELSVHEGKRRRGYGRAIMVAAVEIYRSRGVVSMDLNVFGHNDPARALYDSLGFKVVSTSMKLTL